MYVCVYMYVYIYWIHNTLEKVGTCMEDGLCSNFLASTVCMIFLRKRCHSCLEVARGRKSCWRVVKVQGPDSFRTQRGPSHAASFFGSFDSFVAL